jgi:hypothetical protein
VCCQILLRRIIRDVAWEEGRRREVSAEASVGGAWAGAARLRTDIETAVCGLVHVERERARVEVVAAGRW